MLVMLLCFVTSTVVQQVTVAAQAGEIIVQQDDPARRIEASTQRNGWVTLLLSRKKVNGRLATVSQF